MATTKIPSQASVRRALTTLKKYGCISEIKLEDIDLKTGDAFVILRVDKLLLSPKKTSRKKPKHKAVKPEKFSDEVENKSSTSGEYVDEFRASDLY